MGNKEDFKDWLIRHLKCFGTFQCSPDSICPVEKECFREWVTLFELRQKKLRGK